MKSKSVYLWIIAVGSLLSACTSTANEQALDLKGYNQRSIRLSNGLGVVSIYLPHELDTSYSCVDFGEYHCAEVKVHRFLSKKYACFVTPKSEFSYDDLPDSLYQLSILQTHSKDCESYVTIDEGLLKGIQSSYAANDKKAGVTPKQYLTEINGRKFVIREAETKIDSMEYKEVDGFTDADGRLVKFIFKCYCKHAGNFLQRMMASMKTIQISTDEANKS